MKKILFLLSIMIILTSCTKLTINPANAKYHYGVFIGAEKEKLLSLKSYDLLIVDAESLSSADIESIHKNGNSKIYSYLNIGSIEEFRSYYDEFLPYTIGEYENWEEEKWVDVSSELWQARISSAADELINKGIDGIFADNSDIYYIFPKQEIYNSLISIFNSLYEKGIDVIVNGGDMFISETIKNNSIPKCIIAVTQESVYTSIDFQNNTFGESRNEDREYYLDYLDNCARNGLAVYLIEYGVSNRLKEEIDSYCTQKGFYCFYADSLNLD